MDEKSSLSQVASVFLYGEETRDDGLEALHIEPLRERSMRHDWVIAPHRHPDHVQLMLITEGGGITRFEGVDVEHRAGDLVIHPAGMIHSIRYQNGTEGMTITMARDDVTALRGLLPDLENLVAVPRCVSLSDRRDDMRHRFDRIYLETRTKNLGWRAAVQGQILMILTDLCRVSLAANPQPRNPRDRELTARFRQVVEAQFRSSRSVANYAAQLAISPQRLNGACKSAVGQSASDILYHRIIAEARRALAYSEMTVAEIGHDLGFPDPAYFNRFFARHVGLPPGEWRSKFTATEVDSRGKV